MEHSFNVEVACKEGLEAACVYSLIAYYHYDNRALGHCYRKGEYWVDFSIFSYEEFLPYLTRDQIKNSLDKLVKDGLIEKGDFKDSESDYYKIKEV